MTELIADTRPLSPAAERMRRHRQRRRVGLQCVFIELRRTEIEALIRKKLLRLEDQNEDVAIRRALHEFLDQTLGREL